MEFDIAEPPPTIIFFIILSEGFPYRYVQIPKHLNIQECLEAACQPLGRGRGRGRGEISRGRMKILGEREQRRQEDLKVCFGYILFLRNFGSLIFFYYNMYNTCLRNASH